MNSNEIRDKFLQFFEEKKHKIVPSAPIVQKDDPTLMFTNSGMVQFKDNFLGYEKPVAKKVADSQKCLRVSGKHNDLDDVGKDTYHHTMFEMLGNWSFNDYFKKEAIAWAWEFLTEVVNIPKENLYVTIFEGDASENLERDTEAFDYWKEWIPENRILDGNKKDNFWEMGDQGPCGPCSEIHVDLRPKEEKEVIPGKDLVNKDHPLVVEIWNLVFMEYLRKADGSITTLGTQNVDTGMGFERLCMTLQGKSSTYDTDLFIPLIKKVEELSGFQYGKKEKTDIAIRVIVDHIRTLAFTIADGQIPSNTGAGYVIRRILRRAIGYGYRVLNLKEPFLYQLLPVLTQEMGEAYPELKQRQDLIIEILKEEETSFLRTLEKGLTRLDALIDETKLNNHKVIDGKLIYELKDTYGFPPDFSRIIIEENNLTLDEKGFMDEEKRLKNLSRQASQSKASDWVKVEYKDENGFLGQDTLEATVKINRYRKIESNKGNFYQLVFDQTPFYAEGGGQVGDTGLIINGNEQIRIEDTKKELGINYSIVSELPSDLESEFFAKVDVARRQHITLNHSATHLLHEALREVLGNHVEQKGSLVAPNELRFDFSHFAKTTNEELAQIEKNVNQKILEKIPLQVFEDIPMEEALERGALALFGEKYGENVRMIQFASSKELCGGCHVHNTSDIFHFKILSESSVASGVRRIHAITGSQTLNYLQNFEQQIHQIGEMLNQPQNVVDAVFKQQQENIELKKQIEQLQKAQAGAEIDVWKKAKEKVGKYEFIGLETQLDSSSIKDLIFQLKGESPDLVLVITSVNNEKPMISVGISEQIRDLNAGAMVKELAKEIQGGGGGQPHFATAGGKNKNGLSKVIPMAKELLN